MLSFMILHKAWSVLGPVIEVRRENDSDMMAMSKVIKTSWMIQVAKKNMIQIVRPFS